MLTGQKIANLRSKANMTQEQLAEKLFVSRELVSKWECGKCRPDHKSILKMAEIFSVDPDEMIQRDDAVLTELSGCIPDGIIGSSAELMACLNDFLSTLTERDGSIFIRRYYFMEDTSDIAEKFGIKNTNVRTVLMRARKKLTKYLREVSR